MNITAAYLAKNNSHHVDVIKGVIDSIDKAVGITGYARKNPQLIAAMISHIDSELKINTAREFMEYARGASEGLQGLGTMAVNGSFTINSDATAQLACALTSLGEVMGHELITKHARDF